MKPSTYLFLSALAAGPFVAAAPAPAVVHQVVNAKVDVYVNKDNKPLSTMTSYATEAPTQPTGAAFVQDKPKPKPKPKPKAPAPKPAAHGSFNHGVAYSPYAAGGGCKSAQQVSQDIAQLGEYDLIRTYGTDCNQIANTLAACGSKQIILGIFDINNVQSEAQSLISQVKGKWGQIHTVSVGNELVNQGKASVGQVTAAIGAARSALRAAGYTGPVVTVDTMNAMDANMGLCEASDYCAINCHAFFDPNTQASDAGTFVKGWIDKISAKSGGKKVIVTESGWPTKGGSNNKAVPSPNNQQAAIASIKSAVPNNLVLYTAYNDLWKGNSGATFGAEQFWGMHGNAPSG